MDTLVYKHYRRHKDQWRPPWHQYK